MQRLTQEIEKNKFCIQGIDKIQFDEKGYCGETIDRLAKYENLYEFLVKNQAEVTGELEKLRAEGKTKTVSFNQLMVKKLTNANMISMIEIYVD